MWAMNDSAIMIAPEWNRISEPLAMNPSLRECGYASAAPENLAKVEGDFREELARLLADGVSAEEVHASVDGLLKKRLAARADDGGLAAKLAADLLVGHTMKELAEFEARLQALTPDVVNAAARKYFKPEAMSFFSAGDFDAAAKKAAAKP